MPDGATTSINISPFTAPITFTGKYAILEPLSASHHDELVEAVSDGELWKLWYTSIPEPQFMRLEIKRRLRMHDTGSMMPWAVRSQSSGKIVGMTTFMNIDSSNRRVEIGATWYAKSAQRTALNTECKLMLLTYAFDKLKCIAVEFRTSFHNQASRKAIERLGAKQDGILRSHQLHANGTLRDTVVYSIIAAEWATVKEHLQFKLAM